MTNRVEAICDDLRAEHDEVDGLVGPLDPPGWSAPTPADGWTVRDTVAHLCYFDEIAAVAVRDGAAFADARSRIEAEVTAGRRPDTDWAAAFEPAEILARWRVARDDFRAASLASDGGRVPWFGPSMGVASLATARLMETWAHGQDIVDCLGGRPVVSARLRHICHLGVAARPYAFAVNGREDPAAPVGVKLFGPGGEEWLWGPPEAPDRITGTALDFALLVTQRRNRTDTRLVVEGPVATEWAGLAQAFAGPAGGGRPAGLGPVEA